MFSYTRKISVVFGRLLRPDYNSKSKFFVNMNSSFGFHTSITLIIFNITYCIITLIKVLRTVVLIYGEPVFAFWFHTEMLYAVASHLPVWNHKVNILSLHIRVWNHKASTGHNSVWNHQAFSENHDKVWPWPLFRNLWLINWIFYEVKKWSAKKMLQLHFNQLIFMTPTSLSNMHVFQPPFWW